MTRAAALNVDLHCHSSVSDGVLEPAQVAARAHANGVQMWALTDHDELSGVAAAAQAAGEAGMQFIPGVEISATWASQTVHIVGLGVDPGHPGLNAGLAGIRASRVGRARKLAQRLEDLGIAGSYEGALRYAANPALVSRTHFARFLVDQGYCKNMQAVFDKYLGDRKPANVAVQWSALADAVDWITAAGGRAVIAHPGRYAYSLVQSAALFDRFKELGGVAIEVITGSHHPDQYRQYADVARHYGFLASCGSDFHSPSESRIDLGSLPALPGDLRPVWYDWV
jgi:predicted metal-dependent phosphoesterase TrpH